MNMEGLTVGANKAKPERLVDFNASCISILSEGFLDPMDNMVSDEDGSVASCVSDLESVGEEEEVAQDGVSMLGSDSDFFDSDSDSDSEAEEEEENEEPAENLVEEPAENLVEEPAENLVEEPKKQPTRSRGFIARMASSDSLFGGGRPQKPGNVHPQKPEGSKAKRGFLSRMASSDSLFGGRRPRNPDEPKSSKRGMISRMGSSDSLFGAMASPFARRDSHKPNASRTRRGGRRNKGETKEDEPSRGVARVNTSDSLIPSPIKRRSTNNSMELACPDKPVVPHTTRTRRGGRRNRGGAPTEGEAPAGIGRASPPQRGVVRNNTSDSLVQGSRPSRRSGRRPPQTPKRGVRDAGSVDSPTEGESASESSTLLEMPTSIQI